MIRVNLVPRELLDREVQRQRVLQASVVGIAVALVVVGVSVGHWYRASKFEAQLGELNKEYDKLAKIVAQVEELERTANAVRVRLGVIQGLLKGRPLYPYFMADLLTTMPPGVWLTGLTTSQKEPNTLAVTLPATANSSEGVSQWLRNLAETGQWEDPKLSAISVSNAADSKTYSFSLTTIYKCSKF
ncbi:MAG: PilN domain-containing protein [Elusimicrobia bacterium]|nr:PilN domain-containing protein [Elusimicrobiota bacterium]